MLNDNEMLNSIRKDTQMGCFGIDRVMPKAKNAALKTDLGRQRDEYREIYAQADEMLQDRGGKRKNLSAAAKISSGMMSNMQTLVDDSSTKIAEMMITGNTMGVTKSIRHIHDYYGGDRRIEDIANKLLETEQRNIVQMQQYL